jgi:chemotaxis protein MotB
MSKLIPENERRGVNREWLNYKSVTSRGSWIISYADLMTIILTFFILLLSISTIKQTRFEVLVDALTGEKVGNLQEVKQKIDEIVEREALGGQVSTSIDEDGLTVEFANALLFESGEAQLTERADEVLEPIAGHLVTDLESSYGLIIEGYTDDVPISTREFRSNWELSTSRGINVMRRLNTGGLDARRMSVQGFADTRPATEVDLNDTRQTARLGEEALKEVRAMNRRVIIRIDTLDPDVLQRIVQSPEFVEVDEAESPEPAGGQP